MATPKLKILKFVRPNYVENGAFQSENVVQRIPGEPYAWGTWPSTMYPPYTWVGR